MSVLQPILSKPTVLAPAEVGNIVGVQYMKRCSPLLAVLWIVVILHWIMRGDGVSAFVTVMAAVASVSPYIQAMFGVSRLKRRLAVPHQYEISARTLKRIYEDGDQSKYPWHIFEKAVFHGEYLLLFLNWTAYVIVPLRSLSEDQLIELRSVLTEHNLL